jgi:hypothetical protein
MLPHQVQTLLDDLESLGSVRSGYETAKAAARALMRDEAAAVALATELSIGSEWGPPIGAQKGPHFLIGSRPEAA